MKSKKQIEIPSLNETAYENKANLLGCQRNHNHNLHQLCQIAGE